MRFQDIELFVAVVEEGSFSSAARRLNLTQPAVSSRIHLLEKELGTSLVVREPRRVLPTPAGHLLYTQGLEMLRELESLQQRIQQEARRPVGPLVLAAGEASGVYMAPVLLGAFRERYPEVRPVLQINRIAQTTADLLEQRVRLGIMPGAEMESRLEGVPLCQDDVVLIVPPGHRLAERSEVEAAEIVGEPFLTREGESRMNSHLSRVLAPLGVRFQDLHVVMQLGNNEAIKVAVAAGLGIAFVSTLCLRSGANGLRRVRVRGLKGTRTFQLVRRIGHPVSFAEQLFWEFCQSDAVQEMLRREFGAETGA